jgi:hypothetical protein
MTSLAIQAVEKEKTVAVATNFNNTDSNDTTTATTATANSTTTKVSKKANMSHLHSLYNDAKARKEKRKETKKKYEEQTGCTFQPTLHKSSSRFKMKTNMKNNKSNNSPSTPNRFHRLYQQATDSQRKRKERIAALPYNCTFKPKLSKKSASYKPRIAGSVGNRLYEQATAAQKKKKDMEKIEGLRGCTFKPKLNTKAKSSARSNLYDLNHIKQKKILLEQKRMESEIRGCTFSPALAPKTEKLAEKTLHRSNATPENNAVYNRLHSSAKRREEKIEQMRRARVDNSMAECSFKPKISRNSKIDKKLNNLRKVDDSNNTIGTRLYEQGKRSMEKKKKLVEDDKIRMKNLSNFKNKVYKKADQDKLFNRLYEHGKRKTQKRKNSPEYKSLANAKMEAMDLRECTFKPAKISNIYDASLDSDRYTPPLSKMKDGSQAKRSLDMNDREGNSSDNVPVIKKITRSSLSPKPDDSNVISTNEIKSALIDPEENKQTPGIINSNKMKKGKEEEEKADKDSAIDMLSQKIDRIDIGSTFNSATDNGEVLAEQEQKKTIKKVDSRNSIAV